MRRLASGAALVLVFGLAAQAHDIARTESKLDVRGNEVEAALLINLTELRDPKITFDSTGRITASDLDRWIDGIFASVRRHYRVRTTEEPARVELKRYVLVDGHAVHLEIVYVFPHPVDAVEVTSTFYGVMNPGHEHFMSVRLHGTTYQAILNERTPSVRFEGTRPKPLQTLWTFGRLGVEHIFTGYDHLAFLVGLIVATTTLSSLVKVITSFTVAHSITLALATFNLVALPTRLTESLIALSIAYVAAENLFHFRAMKRYYITFLFGLVHGFGFSTVLRDMELPRASLALSLFSFNLGVEIGQVVFVLLIFPAVQDLVKSGWTKLQPAASTVIACLAVWWFVQRAFLT